MVYQYFVQWQLTWFSTAGLSGRNENCIVFGMVVSTNLFVQYEAVIDIFEETVSGY